MASAGQKLIVFRQNLTDGRSWRNLLKWKKKQLSELRNICKKVLILCLFFWLSIFVRHHSFHMYFNTNSHTYIHETWYYSMLERKDFFLVLLSYSQMQSKWEVVYKLFIFFRLWRNSTIQRRNNLFFFILSILFCELLLVISLVKCELFHVINLLFRHPGFIFSKFSSRKSDL